MKPVSKIAVKAITALFFSVLMNPLFLISQENTVNHIALEDYINEFSGQDGNYLAEVEEWCSVIDQWLGKPLCINNEDAEGLVEYKIISLLQLNKLKEYRYMYGDLLSVHELSFIEGWDFQTVRKVKPLVTTLSSQQIRPIKKFTFRSLHQSLVIKTSFHTQKTAGYKVEADDENADEQAVYAGSPIRMSLRYDLAYRNKVFFGFRTEKDPGEQFLIGQTINKVTVKLPDLLTGYLLIKKTGPVESLVLGNYRVSFGYGINLSSGQSSIKNRSGLSGMANQIKPQTSVSETGYYRGAAFTIRWTNFSLSGFGSYLKNDGTSVVFDSLTGKALTFSSINKSGLHRTVSEIENRKKITEKTAGGFLVYQNQWLKTGIIAVYNRFEAAIESNGRSYSRFGLTGKGNLISGISATIWLPGIYLFNESSISRNRGFAAVSGLQFQPVPGISIFLAHRYFGTEYQNMNGSGFLSAGNNSGESGIQVRMRAEMPAKWLIEFIADQSRSHWVSYDLAAPARRKEIGAITEKAWQNDKSIHFSFRYVAEAIKSPGKSEWICHTETLSQYRIRIEGRVKTASNVKLKSRVEINLVDGFNPSWLMFQDIELSSKALNARFWLRACFFEASDYAASIYAYENDVLYDFTSFLHYGKGLRGVAMVRLSPADWLDVWVRLSTVYYTNKKAGSGWEAVNGNRQNEIEFQLKIAIPG
jgi:hypothetical protein